MSIKSIITFGFFSTLLLVLNSCETKNDTVKISKVIDEQFVLGEGPWWDAEKQELVFVDIDGKALHTVKENGELHEKYSLNGQPGTVVPTTKGNYLIALGNTVVVFNKKNGIIDTIQKGDFSTDRLRFNDGKVAPDGNLWIGTVECKEYAKPLASLYKMNTEALIEELNHITISNGISWSPDGKTMYYIDSPTKQVKAFDFVDGNITNPRVIINTPEDWGTPDGCCIDSDGNLWVAQWGGACVGLWNTKTGELIEKVDIPAKNVTAVAIGGADLKQLFITTASIAMEPEDEKKYPDAGALFKTTIETPGIARYKWEEQ